VVNKGEPKADTPVVVLFRRGAAGLSAAVDRSVSAAATFSDSRLLTDQIRLLQRFHQDTYHRTLTLLCWGWRQQGNLTDTGEAAEMIRTALGAGSAASLPLILKQTPTLVDKGEAKSAAREERKAKRQQVRLHSLPWMHVAAGFPVGV
jgi:hypothetical protein